MIRDRLTNENRGLVWIYKDEKPRTIRQVSSRQINPPYDWLLKSFSNPRYERQSQNPEIARLQRIQEYRHRLENSKDSLALSYVVKDKIRKQMDEANWNLSRLNQMRADLSDMRIFNFQDLEKSLQGTQDGKVERIKERIAKLYNYAERL